MDKEIYERYEKYEQRMKDRIIEMRQWANELRETGITFLEEFSVEVDEEADKLEEMFKRIK